MVPYQGQQYHVRIENKNPSIPSTVKLANPESVITQVKKDTDESSTNSTSKKNTGVRNTLKDNTHRMQTRKLTTP